MLPLRVCVAEEDTLVTPSVVVHTLSDFRALCGDIYVHLNVAWVDYQTAPCFAILLGVANLTQGFPNELHVIRIPEICGAGDLSCDMDHITLNHHLHGVADVRVLLEVTVEDVLTYVVGTLVRVPRGYIFAKLIHNTFVFANIQKLFRYVLENRENSVVWQ